MEPDDPMGGPMMWQRAAIERQRALRSARIAARHEQLADTATDRMRPFHDKMALTHRATERRHRAAAEMHAAYAKRVQLWAVAPDGPAGLPPRFMTAVADVSGSRSVAVVLYESRTAEPIVAAADRTARAAHDLEYLIGEGPANELMAGGAPLSIGGEELSTRWPYYGPALAELGVRSLTAAPLAVSGARFGTVTVYGTGRAARPDAVTGLEAVAAALTDTAILPAALLGEHDAAPSHPLFDDLDFRVLVHQAAGMLAVRNACSVSDALALIRAHAFAEARTAEAVAADIVDGSLALS